MIRHRSGRMTVGQLKERMDARFKAVDRRFDAVDRRFDQMNGKMDAGFSSLHDKLNAILQILDKKSDHHFKILNEHEERLGDLETWRRTTRDIPR
jgi:hypothetical protein